MCVGRWLSPARKLAIESLGADTYFSRHINPPPLWREGAVHIQPSGQPLGHRPQREDLGAHAGRLHFLREARDPGLRDAGFLQLCPKVGDAHALEEALAPDHGIAVIRAREEGRLRQDRTGACALQDQCSAFHATANEFDQPFGNAVH